MTSPIRTNGVLTSVPTSAGDEATKNATTAVIARPPHIQPYTDRRKAETRSSAEKGVENAVSGVIGYCATVSSLV